MLLSIGRPALYVICTIAFTGMIGSAVAQTGEEVARLPHGPKSLLAETAADPTVITQIAGATRTADEWASHLAGMGTAMTEEQVAMLSEYLSLNTPVEVSGADVRALVSSLPADGRELFAANCFSCHGVVTYYLLLDRDQVGWMDIFAAPYHRRLLTGDNERETFASYASHAMPIAEDQVPEAWK